MQPASQTNQDENIPSFPEAVPLSFAQQRLWFLDRLQGPNATYNISLALRLEGRVERDVLEAALADLIRRHESLRTVFPDTADQPWQKILAPQEVKVSLRYSDIEEATLREVLAQEAAWCFDLRKEIPLRAALFRLKEEKHVLLLLLHHIAGDGWSMAPLARDLGIAYAARRAGHAPAWDELPVQYADYTLWQRELLGTEGDPNSILAKQAAWWAQALAGLPELLTLPTDQPRPAAASHRGANYTFEIDAALYRDLLALGRNNRATLFMVLQAGLSTLFTRLGAGTDIPLGSPIAGRTDDTLHDLVGFFANTLVLRTDTSGNPAFQDLLVRVRNNNLAAYKHQDLPFDRLVEVLRPARSLAYQPLFQVMLILQNNPEAGFELPGLSGVPEPVDSSVAKFDLTFSFTESQAAHGPREGMACVLEYATDLYNEASIEMLAERFVKLLRAVATTPAVPIGEIDLLDDAERVRLLDTWNATVDDYPRTQTIHQLFESQAAQTPEAIAAVFEGTTLTYADLNAKASRLAHYLRSLGVGPDVLVGLCVERSLDMIVGLLGILKAGGAYVPLDPAYPPERLAHMLADAKPAVLLTQQHLLAQIDRAGVPAFCLDTESHALAGRPAHNPANTALPDNLAYVIYTSGSTGKPKGVAVRHSGLVNFIDTMQCRPGIAHDEVLLSVTSLSFDIAALELFLPLVAGARVVLASRETATDPGQLAALAEHCGATMMQATPSTWRMLADHGWPQSTRPLKVLCGGEALPVDLARQMLQHAPAIWNMYGPTETTIWSTLDCIASVEENPSIGRPIGNTRIYILDGHLNPVPIGVAGEVFIGGEGLARGYLHRPALTAERFIADPYSDLPGARMYKTGDLARYLPDGRIDYLGRIDNQVKVRGFRIELGEIEAALENCEGVVQAIVVARDDATGGKRLAAYVVPAQGMDAGAAVDGMTRAEALRTALAQSLPDYMLPSCFVWLDRLPLTPNGKIDRKALPAPDMNHGDSAYAAPRTPDEEALAAIWAEVLKIDRIGIHDNFFALGGHSMLAAQVISRIGKAFQVALPLRTLFEMPTVAAIVKRIDEARQEQPVFAAAITPVDRSGPQPLSFGQMRLWFLDRFDTGTALYNIPIAIRMQGRLNEAALARSLNDIVGRHDALRTTFIVEHGTPLQAIAPSVELFVPLIDLADLSPAERTAQLQLRMREEARQPFDLSAGPLLRACLLRLDAEEHVLVLNMHHIVSDGWSIGVLVRELAALYKARVQGLPSPLPDLPVQYADFCHWQRRQLDGMVLQQQMEYWRRQLDGAPALLALPTDRPRPAVQSHRGATVPFTVPTEAMKAIARLGEQTQCTLFMILTAAFNVLLARYSRQSDICIGTAVAHRNRPEVEPLIGLFVNTLVLRSRVELQMDFKDLLQQVRNTALSAYAHQDVPFEQLVEALKPVRHTGHTPLFQVMLALQNSLEEDSTVPGLTMQPEFVDSGTAKFDLTLNVMEQAGQLQGVFEYDAALFDAATIERMASHFLRLIEAITARPDMRVGDLPLLGEDEARQLLIDWNDTAVRYPHGQTVHCLFEAQAARMPDAIALSFEDEQITYAELNARANRLAHHLGGMGVGPDMLVGICLERSLDMIVGLLAILKAGGAYLPLDPVYPQERLAYMLADAKPVAVLTQQHLQARLRSAGVPVFCLDAQEDALHGRSIVNPENTALPGNLAYVIYTSGSTGKPKGVGITHQAINRLVFDTDYVRLQAGDKVAQIASSSFDAITFEVWSTLLHGGELCVIPYETIVSPASFAAEIKRLEIDALFITAALFTQIAFQAPDAFSSVRDLLVGGDAVDPRAVAITLRSGAPRRLLNAYGPTESTTFALWHLVESVGADTTNIPLGRPIANTQIYLLDAALNPVPIGVAGELYIAGDGLARGYLGRPALTAERFIANPFSCTPGARMYKTGDLARYLSNGNIEYLGRIDNQVKIRGFRIEPGEIEAALAALPGVREAVVQVREDAPGDKRLAAYLVTQSGMDADALRSKLAQTLPDYMVPSHFILLDYLPLTPNGKIDRKALPAPSASRGDEGYAAPRTPTEETLATIWAEVLKLDRVGIHDNFFALGGHSLLAITLLDRMRNAGLQADVRALFAAPTIAALASGANRIERET
ncbi:MAG TPA: amino acid adenylation domain-containing protein, partial [Noviherbaspirillum sp.]